MKTFARFSGAALDGSKAGILVIRKIQDDGGMIAYIEVALSEQEVRDLRDECNKRLGEV
jgi:hypothetical protein